jgi:hypothetical protein
MADILGEALQKLADHGWVCVPCSEAYSSVLYCTSSYQYVAVQEDLIKACQHGGTCSKIGVFLWHLLFQYNFYHSDPTAGGNYNEQWHLIFMQLVIQHTNGWLALLVFQLHGKAKEHRHQMHVLLKVSFPSFTITCSVGLEGMDPCTDHSFNPRLREVLDKAMSSGECLLGGCTDSMVVFCTLMVKRDVLQPWPPPHQLEKQGNGVQLRPTPWPSFMGHTVSMHWQRSLPLVLRSVEEFLRRSIHFQHTNSLLIWEIDIQVSATGEDSIGAVGLQSPWLLPAMETRLEEPQHHDSHDIQEMGAALPSAHDFIQFPWDPGSHLQHRLGGKPNLKERGMLGVSYGWAVAWA